MKTRSDASSDLSGAYFYQTIDLPGQPTILGAWDLRADTEAYLGHVDLAGKRVLEIGAANGYLSFHMEQRGATVIALDLSPDLPCDLLPTPGLDATQIRASARAVVAGLNRAWWHAHRALGSRASLVHATAYDLPPDLAPVDVCLFGSVLLHLRDPFAALSEAAQLTREAIVVTDTLNPPITAQTEKPLMLVNPTLGRDAATWWFLSPGAVKHMLAPLGFSSFTLGSHHQLFRPGFAPWGITHREDFTGPEVSGEFFTVVARRS
jgi:SAM-dependent methyltransferase